LMLRRTKDEPVIHRPAVWTYLRKTLPSGV
jgi:hypothetical protein